MHIKTIFLLHGFMKVKLRALDQWIHYWAVEHMLQYFKKTKEFLSSLISPKS